MAQLILKCISSSKLYDYPIVPGQLIFCRDTRTIYMDTDERTAYQQIMIFDSEIQRVSLPVPVQGFYFVEETGVLWEYTGVDWIQINKEPEKQLYFDSIDNFPEVGDANKIYVDGTRMYRYINGSYLLMTGGGGTAEISWVTI